MGQPDVVFLDFEASSLKKAGYPIEVAWVFGTGFEETHLIKPAPDWIDWADDAQAIHGISRATLVAEGEPHDAVAQRMLTVLSGLALYATAPSWDGHWLSRLLRAAGLPRHALRLQDSDVAHRDAIIAVLNDAHVPWEHHSGLCESILAEVRENDKSHGQAAHRALADARREAGIWHAVRQRAAAIAAGFEK